MTKNKLRSFLLAFEYDTQSYRCQGDHMTTKSSRSQLPYSTGHDNAMASFQSDFENYSSDDEEALWQPRLPPIQEEPEDESSSLEWDSDDDFEEMERRCNELEDGAVAQEVKEEGEKKEGGKEEGEKEEGEVEGDKTEGEEEEGEKEKEEEGQREERQERENPGETWSFPRLTSYVISSSSSDEEECDAKELKKQLTLAKDEIQVKTLHIDIYVREIKRLEKLNSELTAKNNRLDRLNTALRHEVQELKAKLERSIDESDDIILQLEDKLAGANTRCKNMWSLFREASSELEEMKKAAEEFKMTQRCLEADIRYEEEKNGKLKRELEETKKTSEKFPEMKELLEASVEHERGENAKLKRELEKAENAAEDFAKMKESLQADVLHEQAENAKLKKELEETKSASEGLAKVKESLQATVEHEQKESARLKRELEETKKVSEGFVKVKESLQATVQHEQEENARLKRELEETKKASERLVEAKESLQATVLQEQEENSRLTKELKEAKNAAERFAKVKQSLKAEMQHEQEENARLKRALEESKLARENDVKQNKTELREMLRDELGKLEVFQGAYSNKLDALRKENDALERSVSSLSDRNNDLTSELAETKKVVLEKETLEITVKKLTLVNKKQAKKLDVAKKAYTKVARTLEKLQEDSSSVESLELTKGNSTITGELESKKALSNMVDVLKEENEALQSSVGLLTERCSNLMKELANLDIAAQETLEATVHRLTMDNKRQAQIVQNKEQLLAKLEFNNKSIQQKLHAENGKLKLEETRNVIGNLRYENETLKRSMKGLTTRNNLLNKRVAMLDEYFEKQRSRKPEDPATPSRHMASARMGDGRRRLFEERGEGHQGEIFL
ncbi:hypothetical protein Bbelb_342860 [Branchiostoma belcheri]|nr:hypothetical protein Bbelb_342860 [Branchiostoma belcheri]